MLAFSTAILAGCFSEESSDTDLSHETTAKITDKNASVDTTEPTLKTLTSNHTITVDGQTIGFKATYGLPENRANNWYFTQPSSVSLSLQPTDLPSNYTVTINEIYSDVTMISKYARYNGVRQDSLDTKYTELKDGGINIDNKNAFELPFQVEGVNENETSFYMINGYGESDTDRITESDLRENVQGGALKTVWTILITNKTTGTTYGKTIQDSIGMPYKQEKSSD